MNWEHVIITREIGWTFDPKKFDPEHGQDPLEWNLEPPPSPGELLNQLGADGWELVSHTTAEFENNPVPRFVMKRPRSN